ncbi:MAG: Alkyl hydroperoxide reductase/ Thiol specific antioxidant/ Mal allergen [Microgenomates group bacterium GW2011_GWA2_44_7]|nr:MAG: Alkyl hydroperoxide reductase/ Thiol specific antioxidant/ Mal allergen [Microgenomates group bacterium GW2011_GWA2_44_7]KKT78206.1 MAG: Alkyl hydroperoxide reductase/ Thiol specific antioxidant/ Mal allergen [Microgenomates group bacterium GW2011_GWB1_44_8]
MNNHQKQNIIIATEIIIAVVALGFLFIKSTSQPLTKAPVQTQESSDAMADHHKPKAAESGVFDSLLGKPAPDFTLPSYDGKLVSLKDYLGKNVVLFFNEGLMCYPSCWNQIVAFGQDKDFLTKNAIILNITVDSKDDWKKAVDKMPELAGNTVLLDSNREVSGLYGVLTLNSSMHRGQFPGHTYILIDKEGVVRFVKDDVQMAVRNKELLTELAKL